MKPTIFHTNRHLRLKTLGFIFSLHSVSVILVNWKYVILSSNSDFTLAANSVNLKDLISFGV